MQRDRVGVFVKEKYVLFLHCVLINQPINFKAVFFPESQTKTYCGLVNCIHRKVPPSLHVSDRVKKRRDPITCVFASLSSLLEGPDFFNGGEVEFSKRKQTEK